MPRSPLEPTAASKARSETTVVDWIREWVADSPPDRPLPTTRELGRRFSMANATAFRVLQKMAQDGELWQHPTSGRYYPKSARVLFDRPTPLACLIRRLELNSELYRELMEGVSEGCGALHRTMLLWHDELLVNHPDPRDPPVFATVAQQRAILSDFLDRHGKSASSFLLDHIWSDEALSAHLSRLKPGVVLFRSCSLPGMSNIRADFRAGAFKALTHLLDRGYERIIPVVPFTGDPAVTEFITALEQAAADAGCGSRIERGAPASSDSERAALIDHLRSESRRAALVCPEDNAATFLVDGIREAGLLCPERVGVLSVMGTDFATKARVTCLRYDFRLMGKLAVDALTAAEPVRQVVEPQLLTGATT